MGTGFSSTKVRPLRILARKGWLRGFRLLEKVGLHVLPTSYYSPVQSFSWLQKHKELWTSRSRLIGIDWDIDRQLGWIEQICGPYYAEVAGLDFYRENSSREWGPGYGPIESQVLHCFIRSHAPAHILEIGSGLSTICMLRAAQVNQTERSLAAHITCVDPYARRVLLEQPSISVIKEPCQAVSTEIFSRLRRGDLLFIDSSHAVKVGSDVIRIYLDILPSLPPGIFVHIHDINLPYLYGPSTLSPYFSGNSQETALLTALLTNNQKLAILCALSALHYDRGIELKGLLQDYQPEQHMEGLSSYFPRIGHIPSSIWLETR